MEGTIGIGNSPSLHRPTRNTGPWKSDVNEVTRGSDGSLIRYQQRRMELWAGQFRVQFKYFFCPCLQVKQCGQLPVHHYNWHRAVGPDGMSQSFFRNDGGVLRPELTKLLGSVWKTEEIPEDKCKCMTVPIYKEGDRSSIKIHRGIGLIGKSLKVLEGIILRRLVKDVLALIKSFFVPVWIVLTKFSLCNRYKSLSTCSTVPRILSFLI